MEKHKKRNVVKDGWEMYIYYILLLIFFKWAISKIIFALSMCVRFLMMRKEKFMLRNHVELKFLTTFLLKYENY